MNCRLSMLGRFPRQVRMLHSKVTSLDEAMKFIRPGQTILSGGFGTCGIPDTFLTEIAKHPETLNKFTLASNNGGAPGFGVDRLINKHQISRMIMSYIGARAKETLRQFMTGELDIELTPQGTLAERARAGGAGVGAFYTRTGTNTWVEEGKMPLRHDQNGQVIEHSKKKETRVIDGIKYILEYPLKGDVALVHASKADHEGNLYFEGSTANFNEVFAKAAQVTLVEADEIVETGTLHPNDVHLPGLFVTKVVQSTAPKHIEVLKLETSDKTETKSEGVREKIARRVALELKNGSYCNLGVGLPTLVPSYLPEGIEVKLESENGLLGLGPYPSSEEEASADLINAGKEACTLLPGASAFSSDVSFGLIRAGKLDTTILGAIEVSQYGDLANWGLPGRIFGTGGAMDLVSNPDDTRVIVATTHTDKKGQSKIVSRCEAPLTGAHCVNLIVTELAVFEVHKERGLTLVDIQSGSSIEEIKAKTSAPFNVALKDSPKL